ncbi:hypothetical protein ACIPYS_05245 [Kitasatospora sp. NPDC089913]|uniref:hypothetical protein n=1 Tax=Kitasatospora sp. NPDC089913 TaxID=3364080 RepID=UPI003800857E
MPGHGRRMPEGSTMPRHTFGDAMPSHLRAAAVDCVLLVVEPLQDVLEATAAPGGTWAAGCMFRANDAQDTISELVGVIAAHLEFESKDGESVRRLLRAVGRGVRTSPFGRRWPGGELPDRIPEWVREQVCGSLAFVVLRLPVLLRCAARSRDDRWPARCLLPMLEAVHELDRLVELLEAVQPYPIAVSFRSWLRRRPQEDMPSDLDHDYLVELVEVPRAPGDSVWHLGGRFTRGGWTGAKEVDRFRDLVLAMLALLDENLHGRRWAGGNGRPLPPARDAAVACLAGLAMAAGTADADAPYWLTAEESGRARDAAVALTARATRGRSFDRTGSHR